MRKQAEAGQHLRALENGRAPATLTGLPATCLQFQARLRSPLMASCWRTFVAQSLTLESFQPPFPHSAFRLFPVRHVHASWLPSMTNVGKGVSLACTGEAVLQDVLPTVQQQTDRASHEIVIVSRVECQAAREVHAMPPCNTVLPGYTVASRTVLRESESCEPTGCAVLQSEEAT